MDQYRFLPLLGRILIGAPFLMSGLSKLATHDATLSFIAAVGLPAPPLAYIVR
jgi:putative oxidoreductase